MSTNQLVVYTHPLELLHVLVRKQPSMSRCSWHGSFVLPDALAFASCMQVVLYHAPDLKQPMCQIVDLLFP